MIPALLALIAAIGLWVALQQMLIARTKLNNDLFDRRFSVYWATRIYMRDMLRDKGATQEDAVKWWTIAAAAPFLFDKEVADHIKEIGDRGSKIRGKIDGKPLYESNDGIDIYNNNYMWISKSFEQLEDTFHDSLNLLRLNPLSLWTTRRQKAPSCQKS